VTSSLRFVAAVFAVALIVLFRPGPTEIAPATPVPTESPRSDRLTGQDHREFAGERREFKNEREA